MCVYLGRRQMCMPKKLLDNPNIRPTVQKVGRKAVAKRMWRRVFGNILLFQALLNDPGHTPSGYSTSVGIDNQGRFSNVPEAFDSLISQGKVFAQCRHRGTAQVDLSVLSAFAVDEDRLSL